MMIQATSALTDAAMKADCHPKPRASRSPVANDNAPDAPMLAACPAVARDINFGSTRSASSLSWSEVSSRRISAGSSRSVIYSVSKHRRACAVGLKLGNTRKLLFRRNIAARLRYSQRL